MAVSEDEMTARLEYLRRAYQSTRDWYTLAETKAQLLLTVNGIFITVVFGSTFGKLADLRATTDVFGVETWMFLSAGAAAIVAAVCCAALTIWSLHGNASKDELKALGVRPDDVTTYRPEALWYFGHIARLNPRHAEECLRLVDKQSEITVLSHHLVGLSRRVLRKHRYVNIGWALTASALVMIAFSAASIAIRL